MVACDERGGFITAAAYIIEHRLLRGSLSNPELMETQWRQQNTALVWF